VSTELRFTVRDLELLPDSLDGTRYEVIDGELYVSKAPHWGHQRATDRIRLALHEWDPDERHGVVGITPGVIFSDHDAVIPDLVWIGRERLSRLLADDGKLHAAPDLVVESVSPGPENEKRDRDVKLTLYSRRGVREYWIVDWREQTIAVFRREDAALHLAATLHAADTLTSPLLPGFAARVDTLCRAD
jgi:Uma2 family endonuclease